MTIRTLTELPDPPSSANALDFDAKADAFLGAFPTLVEEVNEMIGDIEEYVAMSTSAGGSGNTAYSAGSILFQEPGTSITISVSGTKQFVPGQRVALWDVANTRGMAGVISGDITVNTQGTVTMFPVTITDIYGGTPDITGMNTFSVFLIPTTGDMTEEYSGVSSFYPPSVNGLKSYSATEDHSGLIEVATPEEVNAGTDATRAVTPYSLNVWTLPRSLMGVFNLPVQPTFNLFAPNLALPPVSYTRGSSGARVNAAGIVENLGIDLPRFDYAVDGSLNGLLVEASAIRVNTVCASPSGSQTASVTAQAYVLSFYGTGTVVLSGTHSATVVGTGASPTRTIYRFVPTSGTLTINCSGDVQYLQLVAGDVVTSPIVGEGSSVSRSADILTVPLTDIDFNTSEGTIFAEAVVPYDNTGTNTKLLLQIDDGSANNRVYLTYYSSRSLGAYCYVGGTAQAFFSLKDNLAFGDKFRAAFSWKVNSFNAAYNGVAQTPNTSGGVPAGLTTLRIGTQSSGAIQWNGAIRHVAYFPRALTSEQLQAITS